LLLLLIGCFPSRSVPIVCLSIIIIIFLVKEVDERQARDCKSFDSPSIGSRSFKLNQGAHLLYFFFSQDLCVLLCMRCWVLIFFLRLGLDLDEFGGIKPYFFFSD